VAQTQQGAEDPLALTNEDVTSFAHRDPICGTWLTKSNNFFNDPIEHLRGFFLLVTRHLPLATALA